MRGEVWHDLASSEHPLIVAGYSSIDQLVDFVADWCQRGAKGQVRVLLGAEPYPSSKRDFSSKRASFTEEVQRYWLEERGISLRLSAKVVRTIEALKAGQLIVRSLQGGNRLHAKVYVGDQAATSGSSNFTLSGLSDQLEVNSRFTRAADPTRYDELARIADNYWSVSTDWTRSFEGVCSTTCSGCHWQEALARACSELLEGEWAEQYFEGQASRPARRDPLAVTDTRHRSSSLGGKGTRQRACR